MKGDKTGPVGSWLDRVAARYNISRSRFLLVHLGLAVLLAGSGFDILAGREHWPFSNYPMYSRIERDRTVTKLHLYGVPEGAATREFPLLDHRYIQPFDKTRLTSALQQLQRRPDAERQLREAARDVLERYEVLRQAGRHDGPPLQAVRLYRLEWRLDPRARNVDQPDGRALLLEVRAGR